ncbi:MAG: tetratricopeptide repeat protein [Candidatus Omnitrophica bacterium]|nr:tetratricopeptide repeat protein [Candidatus Omnitrophota bacterium]MBU1924534.1 tetratricopeptide repeat protein [Candidatus Omnitrophota bacterium]
MRKSTVVIVAFVGVLMFIRACPAYAEAASKTSGKSMSVSPNLDVNRSMASFKPKDGVPIVTINLGDSTLLEGIKLYNQGKKQEALEKFNQSLAKGPETWNALSWRAATYIDLDMYDEGIKDLDRCLKLEPATQHMVTYNYRGRAYAGKGDLDKALESYKIALDHKKASISYYSYAKSAFEKGLYEEAITNYTNALNHPDTADMIRIHTSDWKAICYAGRGSAYYKKGMQTEAQKEAEKMLELSPRYQSVFGADPLLYYDTEKRKAITDEARAAASRAEASGNMLEAFSELAKAYQWNPDTEKQDKAIIAELQRIYPKLSLKPAISEQARRFYVQAQAFTESENYAAALDAYAKLLAVSPWYPESWFNSAMLRAEKEEYYKAIENMKKYLQLAPEAPDARAAQDCIYKWEAWMDKE